MPHGGVKVYGGKEWAGVWSPTDKRYILIYKQKTYKVAQLICETFHGPKPFDKAIVSHLDEDSRNNSEGNLRWATQKENLNMPKFKENYLKTPKGSVERILWSKRYG